MTGPALPVMLTRTTKEEPVPEEIVRQYLFDRPGHYQIRTLGSLNDYWLAQFQGLNVTTTRRKDSHIVTQITGLFVDQSALAGLLDLLNDLGMVILTVNRLEEEDDVE
jgi:hypothetical protein